MQAEYPQRKNRIKLRVTTSTGLNLLCTANCSHKIKELLPHIVKLYEEVKEDQGIKEEDGIKTRPFIKYIRKNEFLIAPSELVGDIFDDNDEVFCEIGSEACTGVNKESKKEKKEKQEGKQQSTEQIAVPKTKKIKKKNPKQDEKKTQQKAGKEETKKQAHSELKSTEINITEQKLQNSQKLTHDTSQVPKQTAELKAGEQSKSKKKKNKSKPNNNSQQLAQTPVQNKQPTISVNTPSSTKPVQSKQKNVSNSIQKQKSAPKKAPQPTESKPSGASLLSSDQLSKFKELMKKASSSSV